MFNFPTVTKIRSNTEYWKDELECYNRFRNSNCVPRLISYNELELSITTEFIGPSLFQLTEIHKVNITIEDPISQINKFVEECKQNNIVHLDFNPANILLKNEKLFFVDFEMVSVDNTTSTHRTYKRYQKFLKLGGWKTIIKNYEAYFENFDNLIFYTDERIKKGIIKYG